MTTSIFKILCQSCGLTIDDAASALDVRLGTIKGWWLGNRTCPASVITELRALSARQEEAAKQLAQIILDSTAADQESAAEMEKIEVGIAVDDTEAQSLGWPCVGAQSAVFRHILRILPEELAVKVKIVPRGSTLGTARAADVHGK